LEKLNITQGTKLVKLSRLAVEKFLEEGILLEDKSEAFLLERKGVFVTLHTYPDNSLRGCIGFPMPILPLYEATVKAAISAAVNDPRFVPVEKHELDSITFEVSVLTVPEEIRYSKPTELPKLIKIGVDGLIIESEMGSGLLLPQVPVEEGWNEEEYLVNLCIKAGLPPTYWLQGKARILRFTAQIFKELKPKGEVVEMPIGAPTCGYT